MNAQELRRRAGEYREKIAALVAKAEKENRELNEEESALHAEWRKEMDTLNRRATTIEQVEADLAESRQSAGRSGSSIPITNIEPVPGGSEGDKRHAFSHWLSCVDSVCDRRTSFQEIERARNDLDNLYRSEFRRWDTPDRAKETRNLAMNSGTAGGYLMPEGFYTKLMQVAAPMSIVRPRATIIPMQTETLKIPSLDQTTVQTAGSPPYFGGVVLSWSGESASIGSTEPGFRQTTLTLNELTGYTPVGRTLLQKSAISLEPLIYTLFGGAVAYAEDYAFLRGSGVGRPLGIMNAGCRVITATARGSATVITFANATDVWTTVLDESQGSGVWLVSKAAEAAVLKMTGTANSVFAPAGSTPPRPIPSTPGRRASCCS
jgi:HK97 family phage major capsid protein